MYEQILNKTFDGVCACAVCLVQEKPIRVLRIDTAMLQHLRKTNQLPETGVPENLQQAYGELSVPSLDDLASRGELYGVIDGGHRTVLFKTLLLSNDAPDPRTSIGVDVVRMKKATSTPAETVAAAMKEAHGTLRR